MPLKCLSGSDEVFAFNFSSDDEWNALKNLNAAKRHLRMPCCQAKVVLRTSKLGTRHFAHARKGPCTTAPETAEHLLAKLEVVNGIKLTDWTASVEQSGSTPDGDLWRADVLATHGSRKVAFEIQWSPQDKAETRRRQKRYKEAGVRGLWLFKQSEFPREKETPAFCLSFDEATSSFNVLIPSHLHRTTSDFKEKKSTAYWSQCIPLREFVAGALNGNLKFAASIGKPLPMLVHGSRIRCWKCKKPTNVVTSLTIQASRYLPGHPDIPTSIYEFSDLLDELTGNDFILNDPAITSKYEMGRIKKRWSSTLKKSYVSNGCLHCDALQGQFFEHEFAFDSSLIFETEICLRPEWMPSLLEIQKYVNIWWFDRGSDMPIKIQQSSSPPAHKLFPTPVEKKI